jgi:hypothetical protein
MDPINPLNIISNGLNIPGGIPPIPSLPSIPTVPGMPKLPSLGGKNDIPYVEGIIIDASTNQPLKGVKIISVNGVRLKTVKSGVDGKFKIMIPSLDNSLKISLKNYTTLKLKPYKGDNTPKQNLGPLLLKPLKPDITEDKLKTLQIDDTQLKSILQFKKDGEFFSRKRLTKILKDLKTQLLPIAINMIAQYGISKVNEIIQQSQPVIEEYVKDAICPTPEVAKQLIDTKNKLYNKLNSIAVVLDSSTKALGITTGILGGMNIALTIIKNLPTPVSVGGVGMPVSEINRIQDTIKKIDTTIGKLTQISAGTLTTLVIIKSTLDMLIKYLNLVDTLVRHCSPDTPQEQERISKLLADATQNIKQEQPTPNTPTSINGFTLSVEMEVTEKPLKRRRAIAKNRSNVVMLKGEWSFSSIDQILIDELVFYIQQNDLKAT